MTARQVRDSKPEDLLKKAIHGMLPKNRLGRSLHANFRVYNTGEHPHDSQKPETVTV